MLVLSNMLPDPLHPERGSFVRDQVAAIRALEQGEGSDASPAGQGTPRRDRVEVELYEFPPGPRALLAAARRLRARRGERFDLVHAHFGLSAWPALAVGAPLRALTLHGTDLRHPRTRLLTRAALPTVQLLATVSAELARELPARARRRAQVLPCGVDMERFRPLARQQARAQLGLDPGRPCLLFAADPARPEKRHDRALELAARTGVELLVLGGIEPDRVPLMINAANAVLVPSEREGFGLAVLEALACEVPVLATPVGIHSEALAELPGTLCAPYEPTVWSAALAPLLADPDPRVAGRERAERWSAQRMAERVLAAWRATR